MDDGRQQRPALAYDQRSIGDAGAKMLLRYLDRVPDAAVEDIRVWQAVLEVWSVLKPPLALFQLGIVLRVLAQRAYDHEPART